MANALAEMPTSVTVVASAVEQKMRQLANGKINRRFKESLEVVTEEKRRLSQQPHLIDPCVQQVDLARMIPHLALRPRSMRPQWVEERAKQLVDHKNY